MTYERIMDILTRVKDYAGPLYKDAYEKEEVEERPIKKFDAEIKIIDVFDIGPDSAVVLLKRKNSKMIRWVAQVALITNGRVQLIMLAREYMRGTNIRIDNGDHRLNVPASAAGYLMYFATIGTGYRLLDQEYDSNDIERYTRAELLDVIEDHYGYRPHIYSLSPIGGTGTIVVQCSIKKEDIVPGQPKSKYFVISGDKIINENLIPDGKFAISYNQNGKSRKILNASDYADAWLSYGLANYQSMQEHLNKLVETAYDSVGEEDAQVVAEHETEFADEVTETEQ